MAAPATQQSSLDPSAETDTSTASPGRRRARRWAWRSAIALVVAWLAASAAVGTVVFDSAIERAAPLGTTAVGDSDIARTMAAARTDGWAWITATRHERWTQEGTDGVHTAGYWFPAPAPTNRVVVLLHGHRADASLMGSLGAYYRDQGFHVFMADARGHGMSGGDYVGMGYLDQADYLGWLERIVTDVGPDAEILLHGISMGGSTALMLSANDRLPRQVKAVIDDCGFSSLEAELDHQVHDLGHIPAFLPALTVADLETRIFAGYRFSDVDPLAAAARTTRPVFVIHGDKDTYNPTWMGQQIYDAVTAPKKLWLVPGADHGQSYFLHPAAYEREITDFYIHYLG